MGHTNIPTSFSSWHYACAAEYGISADRIGFFEDSEALVRLAQRHGVPQEETERYTPSTYALHIQADDIPGGPDVWIYLHSRLPAEAHMETYIRLESRGLDPSIQFADSSRKDLLYAYLLLHEIGHHALCHGPATPYEQAENEADLWAYERIADDILFPETQP